MASATRAVPMMELEVDRPTQGKPAADLRDYLAEERTFLAWIRTGIALMGFGFVLAHFGVFAEESRYVSGVEPHEFSAWLGAALIVVGVTVNLFSAGRYMHLVGELSRGQFVTRAASKQGVILAMFLALLGIALTIYLILALRLTPDKLYA